MHITQDETNCHWVKKCSFEVWKGDWMYAFLKFSLCYLSVTFILPFIHLSVTFPFQVPFIHLSVTGQFPLSHFSYILVTFQLPFIHLSVTFESPFSYLSFTDQLPFSFFSADSQNGTVSSCIVTRYIA